MDFQFTEEQTLIQNMAKNFAASELAPHSSKWDEEKLLDRNVYKKAAELGFMGIYTCLLYTSPSPRDGLLSRMPSSA